MHKALLLIILSFSLSASAQNLLDTKLSISFNNNTITECIKAIELQTNIHFSYNTELIKLENKVITKTFQSKELKFILDNIFNQTSLHFKQIGEQITIYKVKIKKEVFILTGYILTKESNEKIIGAQLYFPSLGIGCITNSYGYYFIELPEGNHNFNIKSIGMVSLVDSVMITNNLHLKIELEEDNLLLNTIEVTTKTDTLVNISPETISIEKIEIRASDILQLPSTNGLPDITKNLQQISGVQPDMDGSSSYIVRGLSSGNNLILIDEIPIYHPNHLLGIYSVINTNTIKTATFYKDYIPAKFGNRNSSVLNIYTKEGNLTKFHVSGGLGASVPNINFEGPIVKNKSSFYLSARHSFSALEALNFVNVTNLPNPNFYDLTLKINSKINEKNRIYFTTYIGNDKINTFQNGEYNWGNRAAAFRWNSLLNEKTFTNLTIIQSVFKYSIAEQDITEYFGQKVVSNHIKYDLTRYISNTEKLNLGFSRLQTQTKSIQSNSDDFFINRNAIETSLYGIINKTISSKLKVEFGLRIPFNINIGTGDTTEFLKPDYTTEQIIYSKNKVYDFNLSLDPRLLISYQVNHKNKLELSTCINTQFTHVINYNTNILPVEIWTTSSKYLKPERNYQFSFGINHKEKHLRASAILFGRIVSNVIDYAQNTYEGTSYFESNLLSGTLKIAGIELMAHYQKTEKYSANISYNLSYARQRIDGINNNDPYVPLHNRPHYLSHNQYFILSNKWEFGLNFVLHSKTALTLPNGKFEVNNIEYPLYDGTKNTSYLPTHHRIDLSIKRTLGIKKQKNRGYLLLTITNVYARQNISNAFLSVNPIDPNKLEFKTQNYIPSNLYLYYYIKF